MERVKTLRIEYNGKFAGAELELLLHEDEIRERVIELAKQISIDYRDTTPIMIGVLNGCFVFFADLLREMDIDAEVDFIKISSYANEMKTSGTVRLLKDISCNITNRDVIIVEDIIDTGLSIEFVKKRLLDSGPRSVKIVALLMKPDVANLSFPIDYVGFNIPPRFVIGYGLDVEQRFRKLKSIYAFKEDKIQ
jgi:hypoxanthine phosphoribosyltransferase